MIFPPAISKDLGRYDGLVFQRFCPKETAACRAHHKHLFGIYESLLAPWGVFLLLSRATRLSGCTSLRDLEVWELSSLTPLVFAQIVLFHNCRAIIPIRTIICQLKQCIVQLVLSIIYVRTMLMVKSRW